MTGKTDPASCDVQIGQHQPPPFYEVPIHIRQFSPNACAINREWPSGVVLISSSGQAGASSGFIPSKISTVARIGLYSQACGISPYPHVGPRRSILLPPGSTLTRSEPLIETTLLAFYGIRA